MKVYLGSADGEFRVQHSRRSRYGIKALFFATDIYLAQLYASHLARQEYKTNGGFVYEFELEGISKDIDFKNKNSYTYEFRNLIYKLSRENHKIVRITKITDYPL